MFGGKKKKKSAEEKAAAQAERDAQAAEARALKEKQRAEEKAAAQAERDAKAAEARRLKEAEQARRADEALRKKNEGDRKQAIERADAALKQAGLTAGDVAPFREIVVNLYDGKVQPTKGTTSQELANSLSTGDGLHREDAQQIVNLAAAQILTIFV